MAKNDDKKNDKKTTTTAKPTTTTAKPTTTTAKPTTTTTKPIVKPSSGNSESFTDINDVQQNLLGPDYPYWKNIKNPEQLGMSDKGSIEVMTKDVNGLISYVELLVTGKSKASATGGPLGNKFFLDTNASCVDDSTKKEVDRYIYINNVPKGNIPFISYGMGTNFKEFKGLIPGTMSTLNTLNPMTVMQGFMEGSSPLCKKVTLETIDSKNKKSKETHYITVSDIQMMDPCDFPDKKNPETKQKCKEIFTNMSESEFAYEMEMPLPLPNDPIIQLYFAGLGLLGIYIIYKIMEKNK
jgi:hypothetical protein